MGLFKLKCRWEKIFKSAGAYTLFEFAIFEHERGARSCVIHFLEIITAPGVEKSQKIAIFNPVVDDLPKLTYQSVSLLSVATSPVYLLMVVETNAHKIWLVIRSTLC